MTEALRSTAEAVMLTELKNDPNFIPEVIASTRKILGERGKAVTPFDAESMANAVLFSLFSDNVSAILNMFQFPVIDFLLLRDGIKKLIRDALIQDQIHGVNNNVRH